MFTLNFHVRNNWQNYQSYVVNLHEFMVEEQHRPCTRELEVSVTMLGYQ